MSIAIFTRWKGQEPTAFFEQIVAFPPELSGHVGVLREKYRRVPYVIPELLPEPFAKFGEASVPVATLKKRLAKVEQLAATHERKLYGKNAEVAPIVANYRAFVDFCEVMEKETGTPLTFRAEF